MHPQTKSWLRICGKRQNVEPSQGICCSATEMSQAEEFGCFREIVKFIEEILFKQMYTCSSLAT